MSKPMSFDRLAPHYRWMEWVLAGDKLQRCRRAFLNLIPSPAEALLVGEGNGRFLSELIRAHPRTRITCVDASAAMLERARQRVSAQKSPGAGEVEFIQADALEWSPPPGRFNLIVTHFFLDCFRPEQLGPLLARLARAATPEADWLVADFAEPAAGWKRWRARVILQAMYLFFRRWTDLPATAITSPDAWLAGHGFVLRERRSYDWGLLRSDLWTRRTTEGTVRTLTS